MKKLFYTLFLSVALVGCKTTQSTSPEDQAIIAQIDLTDVQDDKVMVTVDPGVFTTDQTVFYIPKIVPGTYSISNYGQFLEDFKAYDYNGRELEVIMIDENSWSIPDAKNLDKVSYWMNDTFDIAGEGDIYSMAGTNILEDKNYLLNLHGFVGYFENIKEEKYRLEIIRPSDLFPGSALSVDQTVITDNADSSRDIFNLDRYFEVIDNPIMYAAPDTATFAVDNMEVLIHLYSPNNKFSAQDLKPNLEKMILAQKAFLGDIDATEKYAILVYLAATPGQNDAGNFGALEHHTSTVVVLPETMDEQALNKTMTDIVSHEFFHILTPLNIHSREIHYFDYNEPQMSKHLWLYEGVTEYFANLFQVNQKLIDEQDFYDRMMDKISTSRAFDDTMPFTEMSRNILEEEYRDSFYNVYQKGALIGMALDIRLRELSNGRMGILDLMKQLASKYGKDRPFEDEVLIDEIVDLTYPEIREFFNLYVRGTTPIPYEEFFNVVGLQIQEDQITVGYFFKDQTTPYITVDPQGNILVRDNIELNSFLREAGLEGGDIIRSINGTAYSRSNVYDLITASQGWNTGDEIEVNIVRNGEEIMLKAEVTEPTATGLKLTEIPNADSEQIELRYTWLRS